MLFCFPKPSGIRRLGIGFTPEKGFMGEWIPQPKRLKSGAELRSPDGSSSARRDFRPTGPIRRVGPSPYYAASRHKQPTIDIDRLACDICGVV